MSIRTPAFWQSIDLVIQVLGDRTNDQIVERLQHIAYQYSMRGKPDDQRWLELMSYLHHRTMADCPPKVTLDQLRALADGKEGLDLADDTAMLGTH